MAVSPAKMYFLEAVTGWMGPVSFMGGLSADGGVEYEVLEEDVEVVVGATGLVIAVVSSNAVAIANVTMSSHSVGYRRLFEQFELQREAMRTLFTIPPLEFIMNDPTNGDEIGDPNAFFLSKPLPSKQKALGDMVYRICLPNGRDQINLGLLNQVGG